MLNGLDSIVLRLCCFHFTMVWLKMVAQAWQEDLDEMVPGGAIEELDPG